MPAASRARVPAGTAGMGSGGEPGPYLSYPVLYYPILFYPTLSYPFLSCPILSCPIQARGPVGTFGPFSKHLHNIKKVFFSRQRCFDDWRLVGYLHWLMSC